jgi:sec-independent protein translocase protein TatA
MTTLLFIGGLGPLELGAIALVLILLFGASKLPKLARSMGSATGEFKKGRQEVEEELQEMKGESEEGADTGVTDADVTETDVTDADVAETERSNA